MSSAAATIVAGNQLALGRVVARSFRRHHPEIPFFLLLADEPLDEVEPEREPFRLVAFDDVAVPQPDRLRFRYTQQPLSYACTPFLIEHLLDQGFERVLFFKQESMVMGRMDDALERLDRCSVLFTPHLVDPLDGPTAVDRELTILLSGVYNNGFVGVSDTEDARRFLAWWGERTSTHCLHAVADGMHFEQRWLDLAPSYFEGVEQLRDPAYNVAHWNLPERRVELVDDVVLVDGRPCRLFRFSGFDPDRPDRPTRYFDRPRMADIGAAARCYEAYLGQLVREGHWDLAERPYAWDRFDNGVPIPEVVRAVYRDEEAHDDSAAERLGSPFSSADPEGFYRWLLGPARSGPATDDQVTNLWHGIWRRRPDVREAFPDPLDRDRKDFLRWAHGPGRDEHDVPHELAGW